MAGGCGGGEGKGGVSPMITRQLLAYALAFTSPTRHNKNYGTKACVNHDGAAHVSSESRRNIITSGTLLCSIDYSVWIPIAQADDVKYTRLSTSPDVIASYVCKHCNTDFLSSVTRSKYKFLYRGLSPDESEAGMSSNDLAAIIIHSEPFDLLDPRTYNSTDSFTYFETLEHDMNAMEMPLKPSNSHIATTNPKDASLWGKAASIWPLGEKGVEFAWIEDGGLFWPGRTGRSVITSITKVAGEGKYSGISSALQVDSSEIMFRADNGFIAVPVELDPELRSYLTTKC